MKIYKKH